MILPDNPPKLNLEKLPEAEHERASYIEGLLFSLNRRCAKFKAALALMDFADSIPADDPFNQFRMDWIFIAARDATSTVYQFEEDMSALGANINKCPTLVDLIDHDAKRLATKGFLSRFPDFQGIRNSHHHQLLGTPEEMALHAHKNPAPLMINSLVGRTTVTTFEGKEIKLELNEDTLSKLRQTRDEYWAAFKPLDVFAAFR